MGKAHLNVSLPLDVLLDSGLSKENAAMIMLRLFVMNLYKRQQISSGKGAEIFGIRKYDFIRMLADDGIDYFDYSTLELDQEFKTIDQWETDNG